MSDKLKVFIIGDYRPGLADGLAEFSYQNAQILQHDLDIHFVEFDKEQKTDFFESKRIEKIQINRYGTKGIAKFSLSPIFIHFLENLPKSNVVFHLNHIYNLHNFLVARKLVKYALPYLFTPHDSYVYGDDFRKSRTFLKGIYRDLYVRMIDKYVMDHAAIVHALTPNSVEFHHHLTKTPVIAVYNQVPDMEIAFQPAAIKNQICFIGRFDLYQKGLDRALEGFKLFKQSGKAPADLQFVFIGPDMRNSLLQKKNVCDSYGLVIGKDVIFTGKISEHARNEALKESKLYLHMSRFEGFGLSVIQALSAFKPVIISSQVPTSTIIEKYDAGYVADTPPELAAALTKVFSMSGEDYQNMSEQARACYVQEFHPDKIKGQLIDLYMQASKYFRN